MFKPDNQPELRLSKVRFLIIFYLQRLAQYAEHYEWLTNRGIVQQKLNVLA